MKKSILNLGEALKKSEQKEITGGYGGCHLEYDALCVDPYGGESYGCCKVGTCQYIGPWWPTQFGINRCR